MVLGFGAYLGLVGSVFGSGAALLASPSLSFAIALGFAAYAGCVVAVGCVGLAISGSGVVLLEAAASSSATSEELVA